VVTVSVNIPFGQQGTAIININSNLQQTGNNITLNVLSVNNQIDGNASNNSASGTTGLESDYDVITLVINADNYPYETSWKLYDNGANQDVATGALTSGTTVYTEDICVDYNSCFTLYVYDSFGDGICCAYGEGDIEVFDALGVSIAYNNGEFDYETQTAFCPGPGGCEFTANVNVTHTSSVITNDGAISINTNGGAAPFQYSIDGGQTFSSSGSFSDLATGTYQVYVQGAVGNCTYEETVFIEACEFNAVEIEHTDASTVITTDGSIAITPTSGTPPYQYSIDGGQSFVSSNEFNNLPVGPYNVIVLDASGICPFEQVVPIEASGNVGIEDANGTVASGIEVYPNPNNGEFWVDLGEVKNTVSLTLTDISGRTIMTDNRTGAQLMNLSIDGPSGVYLLLVDDGEFRSRIRLVKM
jgi:hypothetical protein